MKMYRYMSVVLVAIWVNQVNAVPITNLDPTAQSTMVGQTFTVDVVIDNDVMEQEFLAFGFDVLFDSALLNYLGYSLATGFEDLSLGAQNVAGLTFPGISQPNILLATLSFSALSAGTTSIEVEGLFDGFFSGMYYENLGIDIAAQSSVTIAARPVGVAEPSALLIGLIGLMAMCLVAQSNGRLRRTSR